MYEVDRLRDRKFNGYRRLVIPHALDEIADTAVTQYINADETAKRAILDSLTPRGASVLSVYGERRAAVAVRRQSIDVLRTALVAVGMAHVRMDDYRDNLIVLAALNHSAELLETPLTRLLDQTAGLIPPPALAAFRRYAASDPQHRTLSAMGLRTEGEGPTFRYW